MEDKNKYEIVCPSGGSNGKTLTLNMTGIYEVERRIPEMAFVTSQKAPELLARINEAFLELTRFIPAVQYQALQAEREAAKVRAVILLDRIPAILEAKGLATSKSPTGSADLREAVLDADEEYQTAVQKGEMLRATLKLLEGKLKAFEMAYSGVKKIIGENAYNMSNPRLKDGNTGGFGRANYGKEQ